ncbi:MAG: glycosyltransferase [Dermatophilaceae bacterium]
MYGDQPGDPEQRIRVLWLIKGLGPGGAEQLLLQAARVVDRERFDYEVAYVRPDKTHLVPEFEAACIPTERLGASRAGRTGWLHDLRERMAGADIVHVHSPVLASAARLTARSIARSRRPHVVTTEHNEWTSHRLPTRLANALTGPLDEHTWAVSDEVRETVWSPLRGRFEVLVHGIDQEAVLRDAPDRSTARAALGIADDEVVSLTVANLRRNKDYPNLLAAAREATRREPRLRFLSIGQGPLQQDLTELHARSGLGDLFRFLGYRRDIPAVMAAADIFTLSSAHEGLPVAVMEAFAMGLPVVATSVGGVPKQVRDGVEGRIVPPGDSASLAQALVELAQDGGRRAAMGEAARARAADYDIRRAVQTQERTYRRLMRTDDP